uniref:Secreted protein n=1 Tax=Vitrella brassicaformis TaxID=1169539 RepID=A0A6U4HWC6_9ALVE
MCCVCWLAVRMVGAVRTDQNCVDAFINHPCQCLCLCLCLSICLSVFCPASILARHSPNTKTECTPRWCSLAAIQPSCTSILNKLTHCIALHSPTHTRTGLRLID